MTGEVVRRGFLDTQTGEQYVVRRAYGASPGEAGDAESFASWVEAELAAARREGRLPPERREPATVTGDAFERELQRSFEALDIDDEADAPAGRSPYGIREVQQEIERGIPPLGLGDF